MPSLQQRNKWAKEELSEPKVGDLVWIIDKTVHPLNYPLGRITEVYKRDDENVRSAMVKTNLGNYKRPIVKLIPVNRDWQVIYFWIVDQKLSRHCCGQEILLL